MKRQVAIMVSIALVSFLLGTLFGMSLTGLGIIPNPFNKQLETSESQIKVVKFYQPNEVNVTSDVSVQFAVFKDSATFVWTPNNPNNNSILAIYSYCEYRTENPPQIVWEWQYAFWWALEFRIVLDEGEGNSVTGDSHTIRISAMNQQEWENNLSNRWTLVSFFTQSFQSSGRETEYRGFWVNPNQDDYTIRFQALHQDRASGTTLTYVRNITVFIKVTDGV